MSVDLKKLVEATFASPLFVARAFEAGLIGWADFNFSVPIYSEAAVLLFEGGASLPSGVWDDLQPKDVARAARFEAKKNAPGPATASLIKACGADIRRVVSGIPECVPEAELLPLRHVSDLFDYHSNYPLDAPAFTGYSFLRETSRSARLRKVRRLP